MVLGVGSSILGIPEDANATDVRSGVVVGATTGTLIVPLANTVSSGTNFGPDANGATTGTATAGSNSAPPAMLPI